MEWSDAKIYAMLQALSAEQLHDLYERSRIQDCSCGAKVLPCRCTERRLFDFMADEKWHGWDEITEAIGAKQQSVLTYLRDWRRQFELLTVESRRVQGLLQFRVKKSRGRFYCGCGPRFEPCKTWCPFLRDPEVLLPFWVESWLQRKLFPAIPGFHGKSFRDGYADPPRPRHACLELETRAKAKAMESRCHQNLGLWHPLDFLNVRMPDADTLLMHDGRGNQDLVERTVSNGRNGSSRPGKFSIRGKAA
jgi:hypothetical protein